MVAPNTANWISAGLSLSGHDFRLVQAISTTGVRPVAGSTWLARVVERHLIVASETGDAS